MKIYENEPQVEHVEKTEDSEEREAVRKTLKGEKKKLGTMTWSERFSYIWSYYKIPICVGIVAIIVAVYIVNVIVTRKDTMLMGVIIGDGETEKSAVCTELHDALSLGAKEQVDIQDGLYLTYAYSTGVNTGNMSGSSQILCYIANRELDFFIGDDEGLSYMEKNEVSKDLSEYLSAEDYKHFLDEGRIICNDSGTPTAIDMTGTGICDKLGLHLEKVYVGITALSGHDSEIQGMIDWMISVE